MQRKESFLKGALWMLLSASFLSVSFLAVKLSAVEVSFFFLVFSRFAIALLILTPYLIWRRQFLSSLKTTALRYHIARGAAITGGMYCLYFYITKSTLLNATLFLNIAPMLIPLIEKLFLGYRIGKSTALSLILSFLGALLIIRPSGDVFQWASLIGIAAAFFWASGQTIYGLNVHHESLETSLLYLFLFGTLFTTPALFLAELHLERLTLPIFYVIIGMGVATLLNQAMRGRAYQYGKPSTLATFLYISIVLSALFDALFWGISPSFLTLLGAFLVIIGGISKIVLRHYLLKKK